MYFRTYILNFRAEKAFLTLTLHKILPFSFCISRCKRLQCSDYLPTPSLHSFTLALPPTYCKHLHFGFNPPPQKKTKRGEYSPVQKSWTKLFHKIGKSAVTL